MARFINSLRDWGTDRFSECLRSEILALEPGVLPLGQALDRGGFIDESALEATVLAATDDEQRIQANVGIFFTEIVACCGCGDEPVPENVYCELVVTINKLNAATGFAVLAG